MNLRQPPMELVRTIVAEESARVGVTAALVFSKDRRRAVVWARSQTCKRLRGKYSLPGIGKCLGIDHTSVLYLARREWPEQLPKLSHRQIIRPKPRVALPPVPAPVIYMQPDKTKLMAGR